MNYRFCKIASLLCMVCCLHTQAAVSSRFSGTDTGNRSNARDSTQDGIFFRQDLSSGLSIVVTRYIETNGVFSRYIWETVLESNLSGERTMVWEDRMDNSGRIEEALITGESSVLRYYVLGAYMENDDIYVVYDNFGEVVLRRYSLESGGTYAAQQKTLSCYFTTPTYERRPVGAIFKKAGERIITIVHSWRQYSNPKPALFSINPSTFDIKEIGLQEDRHIISAFHRPGGYTEDWLKEIEMVFKVFDRKHNQTADTVKLRQDLAEPFQFVELSTDDNTRVSEISALYSLGFELYSFFEENNNGLLIDTCDAETKIKEVLSWLGISDNITLADHFCDRETAWFLYFDHSDNLQVIRYHRYHFYWIIGELDEIEIAQEQ